MRQWHRSRAGRRPADTTASSPGGQPRGRPRQRMQRRRRRLPGPVIRTATRRRRRGRSPRRQWRRAVVPSAASRWTYLTEYLALHRDKPRVLADTGMPGQGRFHEGGVEPTLGFEPRTCCLRNSCSTAELCRRGSESSSEEPGRLRAPRNGRTRFSLEPDNTTPPRSVRIAAGWGRLAGRRRLVLDGYEA